MEDAAIHQIDFDNNNSLFAVFDGHGGITYNIQDSRSASMSVIYSLHNSWSSNLIKIKIIHLLYKKFLNVLTNLLNLQKDKNNSIKFVMETMRPMMEKNNL